MKLVGIAIALVTTTTAARADECRREKAKLEADCAAGSHFSCLSLGARHRSGPSYDACYDRRGPAMFVAALDGACRKGGDGFRCTQLADGWWPGRAPRGGFPSEDLGLVGDAVRAIELYERACKLGDGRGCDTLMVVAAPGEKQAVVALRRAEANRRLAALALRGCEDEQSFASCYDAAERLRTGNGIAADPARAKELAALAKVREAKAMEEFHRMHDGNW
jgi:TPR repeat protein